MVRKIADQSDSLQNYYMPAEWSPHEGIWLSWPHNEETFGEFLPNVEDTYLQFIKALLPSEKVFLCVKNNKIRTRVQNFFHKQQISLDNLKLIPIATQDVWFRDYGPKFVISKNQQLNPSRIMINWQFNAWGDKYEDLKLDSNVPFQMKPYLKIPIINSEMVLEGGSIDVNGQGTLLTTEQCLLNPNRNPTLSKVEIEEKLSKYLGVSRFIWLKEGIEGDDTDGHIDDIARFVAPNHILCTLEENTADPNYKPLQDNFQRLKQMHSKHGLNFKITTIPMPDPVVINDIRLPASYVNFYIGNSVVCVPTFDQPKDKIALSIIKRCFPYRTVIGINAREMVYGMGTLHCCSQQQPLN